MGYISNAYRAEPPKLILIFNGWAWTPYKEKYRIGLLHCLCYANAYMNITVKVTTLTIFLLYNVSCPSSPLRNKAKNALSLAKSISPELARAKIGNFRDMQVYCLKNVAFQEKKPKSCGIKQQKVAE